MQANKQMTQKSTRLVDIDKCSFASVSRTLFQGNEIDGATMLGKMSGVVLWANEHDGKAVIWCEDQGDLAYLTSGDLEDVYSGFSLDAGDLIEFDLEETAERRVAYNPELLHSGHALELAESLRPKRKAAPHRPNERRMSDNVIKFSAFQKQNCVA